MVVVLLILGDFVQLDGVHLWDNVRIDDGSKISKSIVCANVHIKRYFLLLARENRRHYHWFPRQIPSEKQAQKFHTDDASLPRSG